MKRRAGRAGLHVRAVRAARTGLHLAEGVATTLVVFPFVGAHRRREFVRRWSARLLRILRVEARIHGLPAGGLPGNLLIVANHVSWLDVFVVLSLAPARFVAKAEIRRWPVVGRLSARVGTMFVERERRRDAHAVNREAARALAAGDVVAVFPEGTTSDGATVLPFKASLLQPIVEAGGHVQPIAIRYRDATGARTDAPAYVGETSVGESFWRVTAERVLVAELRFAPPLPARDRHRRDLAREAEAIIRTALASAGPGSAPDRCGGPEA